jgi:hypothetical protein
MSLPPLFYLWIFFVPGNDRIENGTALPRERGDWRSAGIEIRDQAVHAVGPTIKLFNALIKFEYSKNILVCRDFKKICPQVCFIIA